MSRHARLTVLELGASATAWVACHPLGADDWIVVAQQSDETAPDFRQRVRERAQRLRHEDAQLDTVDVYAGRGNDRLSSQARHAVIQDLGGQMAQGGRLTLWSSSEDRQGNAQLAGILAQLGPILAERQIAMNHQACESEQRSGVRHALPSALGDSDSELEQFFESDENWPTSD